MNNPASPPEFAEHLVTIRQAKLGVDKIVGLMEKTRKLHEKTRAIVQEMLYDHVCLCRELLPKMDDLGEASAIATRAVQSLQRMQDLNEKIFAQPPANPAPMGLPPAMRDTLEHDLHLM